MRVSVVAGAEHRAGPETVPGHFLAEIALGLAALGHDVELITDEPPAQEDLSRVSVWHPHGDATDGSPWGLRRHLREGRPHVVLWHTTALSAFHARPRVLSGTRHFAIFTGPPGPPPRIPWLSLALQMVRAFAEEGLRSLLPDQRTARFLERSFDGVIVLEHATEIALIEAGLRPDRIAIVHPGRERDIAPRSNLWPTVSGEVTFLVACEPEHRRGLDAVLAALDEARATAPFISLLVEPCGPTSARRDRLARMASSDVLVLPPQQAWAQPGGVMLEGAGAGLPLVAPDDAAIRDEAAPGSILFAPGSADGLVAAILRFALDPLARASASTLARDWYDAWPTWEDTSRRLAAVVGLVEQVEPATEGAADRNDALWTTPDATGSAAGSAA